MAQRRKRGAFFHKLLIPGAFQSLVGISRLEMIMAKKKDEGSGLMSSAGLMRYFEADDTAIKLDPKMVVGACIASGAVVLMLNIAYGLWP
jgi:preprotein translocase subunit Sec61beta